MSNVYTGKIETLQELIDVLIELRDIQNFDKRYKIKIENNYNSPIRKIKINRVRGEILLSFFSE